MVSNLLKLYLIKVITVEQSFIFKQFNQNLHPNFCFLFNFDHHIFGLQF